MKSVQRSQFKEIGRLVRTHGNSGELRLQTEVNCKLKEWVFAEVQGKPVPFFIEQKRDAGEGAYLLKLEGINNTDEAGNWVGYSILLPKSQVKATSFTDDLDFTGYQVQLPEGDLIGIVTGIQESPMQDRLEVTSALTGKEHLIPLVDEFIEMIDEAQQTIVVRLPEGFLEI